ncbi:DUF6232 family protein [Streptomyces sp. NPDC058052]|uniref:DUF6232 family protein n=1 Tax=Streptomyces sp. NPDC058052 TaxID=3346316 RepID=UPI0036E16B24
MDETTGPGTPPEPPRVPPGTPPKGQAPAPPPGPPAGPPPDAPPDAPTRRAWQVQPRAAVPRGPRAVDLKVSRGVLWIGTAALPLRHLTSVEVSRAKPDWVLRLFLSGVLAAAFVAFAAKDTGPSTRSAAVVCAIGVGALLLKVAFTPPKPVLLFQTAAGSTAAVTLPDIDELRHVAALIVRAIDDVPTEFGVVVQRVGSPSGGNPDRSVVRVRGGGLSYR